MFTNKQIICAAACAVLVVGSSHSAHAEDWIQTGNGVWTDAANWSPASVPNGIDAVADFSTINIGNHRYVYLNNTAITLGSLLLGDTSGSHTYRFYGGASGDNTHWNNGYAGAGQLIFDVTAGNASISNNSGGSDQINVNMLLNDDVETNSTSGNIVFLGGHITGTGGFIVNSGFLDLRSSNADYTGDTVVNNGARLQVFSQGVPVNNITVNEGLVGGYYNYTMNRTLAGSGVASSLSFAGNTSSGFAWNNNLTVNLDGGATVVWGSTHFNMSTLLISNTRTSNGGSGNFNNDLDLNSASRTIDVTHGHIDLEWKMNGDIIDSGSGGALVKTGNGRLELNGTNTYAGGTTVNGGMLHYLKAAAMSATGTTTFNDGTTLGVSLGGGDDFAIAGTGAGTLDGLLNGIGNGGATVVYNGNVALLLKPAGNTTDITTDIGDLGTGPTDLHFQDKNLLLSGNNTYSGTTYVSRIGGSARTLTLGSNTALAQGAAIQIDSSGQSKLDLAGFNATVGKLTTGSNNGNQRGQVVDTVGGGVLTLTDGVFSDDHNNGGGGIFVDIVDLNGAEQLFEVRNGHNNFNVGGSNVGDFLVTSVIQNGSLRMRDDEGNGSVLRLEGSNTYVGTTTIESGIISTNNVTAFADGSSIVIEADGELNLDHAGIDVISGLTINGLVLGDGIYDSSTHAGFLSGTGQLQVIPEPSTLALIGLGGLMIARRRRD